MNFQILSCHLLQTDWNINEISPEQSLTKTLFSILILFKMQIRTFSRPVLSWGLLGKHEREKILLLQALCDSIVLQNAEVMTNSVTRVS